MDKEPYIIPDDEPIVIEATEEDAIEIADAFMAWLDAVDLMIETGAKLDAISQTF